MEGGPWPNGGPAEGDDEAEGAPGRLARKSVSFGGFTVKELSPKSEARPGGRWAGRRPLFLGIVGGERGTDGETHSLPVFFFK